MLISLCTPVLHNEFYNEVPVYIGFFSHYVSKSRGPGFDSSSRQPQVVAYQPWCDDRQQSDIWRTRRQQL